MHRCVHTSTWFISCCKQIWSWFVSICFKWTYGEKEIYIYYKQWKVIQLIKQKGLYFPPHTHTHTQTHMHRLTQAHRNDHKSQTRAHTHTHQVPTSPPGAPPSPPHLYWGAAGCGPPPAPAAVAPAAAAPVWASPAPAPCAAASPRWGAAVHGLGAQEPMVSVGWRSDGDNTMQRDAQRFEVVNHSEAHLDHCTTHLPAASQHFSEWI